MDHFHEQISTAIKSGITTESENEEMVPLRSSSASVANSAVRTLLANSPSRGQAQLLGAQRLVSGLQPELSRKFTKFPFEGAIDRFVSHLLSEATQDRASDRYLFLG